MTESNRLIDLVQRLRGVNWICHTYGKTEIKHDTVCHEAADVIEELQDAFREIYEVYAGSEGFIPETCAEGYQQQLIKEMSDIAAKHMRKGLGEK
jgi:hypothetical protein